MNKIMVFFINIALLLIVMAIPCKSFADASVKTWDDMASDAQAFIEQGKSGKTVISSNDVATTIMPIARAMVAIATGILVVVTSIMGVKYATASSPDVQAKLKKQLIGLVVSIIVVFGAYTIWSITYDFMNDVAQ